ncbi:transcriptional regulator family: Fungal Specific TF [Penicillium cf. griseofulvum]|uniref:Transcriptional regulator family: Fungal Specific TF n=1 Tax=Penicillium cf. griseofulvum TaxID=2972120 RepID=A0A9W9IZ27_9EURO|nr:transcriptional regulator family: Fungal Specific TF [Penicillium cf. griseofulvum]KAJ5430678.1 transcriptional regulator family: Fungal Specific TF [Penicillium cf. griseofulvum]
MFMTPSQTQLRQNTNPQRLPFRTSCDPCAASKVRCTKEQHGCSRCTQNGLKCVYGRSQRKGKPSRKTHLHSSQVRVSPPDPTYPTGPNYHQPNYNFSCPWYQSLTDPNYSTRETNTSSPSLTSHQQPEDAGISNLPTPAFSWSHMVGSDLMVPDSDNLGFLPQVHAEHDNSDYNETREINNENDGQEGDDMRGDSEDQREPCIAVACQTLSSLYQFIQPDCVNGPRIDTRPGILSPPIPEEPTSDIVFCTTRSAMETVSRLLNCTGRSCAQDPSILLVIGSILLKILSWYEALYQSEIGRIVPSTIPNDREDVGSRPHHSNSSQSGGKHSPSCSHSSESTKYTVPLTIPLNIGFNLSRATEMKMKAQLLLCEVQNLSQLCQAFDRRVQVAESVGEKGLCGQSNTNLLRKLGELQYVLTVVCTQVP